MTVVGDDGLSLDERRGKVNLTVGGAIHIDCTVRRSQISAERILGNVNWAVLYS